VGAGATGAGGAPAEPALSLRAHAEQSAEARRAAFPHWEWAGLAGRQRGEARHPAEGGGAERSTEDVLGVQQVREARGRVALGVFAAQNVAAAAIERTQEEGDVVLRKGAKWMLGRRKGRHRRRLHGR
jgi:hypothetical protein